MSIRTALLYKKNLATLIEESVSTVGAPAVASTDFLLEGRRESALIRTELSFCRRPTSEGTPAPVLLRLWVLG